MLSALIRRNDSEISDKRRGDVICVKLSEFAAWGKVESVVHHVTEWEDFDLEESMRQELESTGISPVRTTPYKIIDNETNTTKTRSEKYFDFLSGEQRDKTTEQIESEFQTNIIRR
tara:strand:+ start:3441 stop:3788 length:348 start_codon:yes stop_codon:yes gene_type:complete